MDVGCAGDRIEHHFGRVRIARGRAIRADEVRLQQHAAAVGALLERQVDRQR